MKKALVVLLAVAMIFAFGATAMAATYTDMDAQSAAGKDAVNFMSALDIIAGYPDGTYGPERNITRAEFAKIAVNAAGLADSADYLNSTASKFSDVKVGVWYTGFINLAQSQGYIQGYPDGTFRPNATITNQEVVTVLLRMLGYTDNLTGPWPVDYINQAVKSGILDDVSFVGAVPAKRVDVAVMTKATLGEDLVVWTKDKDTFEAKLVGLLPVTLLADSFGASTVKTGLTVDGFEPIGTGTVPSTATALDAGAAFAYDADDAELTLNITAAPGSYVIKADTVISDGLTFDQLANHQVNLVLKNAGKKDQSVAYIDVTSYVKAFGEVTTNFTAGKIELDDKNYTAASSANANDFALAADTVNYKVYGYFNDDDEIYASVADSQITAATPVVVKKEATAKGKVEVFKGSAFTIEDDADAMIIKDGKQIKVADLEKYDVVAKYTDLYLVSALDSAKLARVYSTTDVMLGSTKYAAAAALTAGTKVVFDADDTDVSNLATDYIGEEVKYVLDANNKVAFVLVGEAKSSNTVEGIVVGYKKDSGAYGTGGLDTISVFNAEGKTVDYTVDGKYTLAGSTTNLAGYTAGTTVIHVGSYVKFTVDADNKIKTVKDATSDGVAVKGLAGSTKVETNKTTNRITVTGGLDAGIYNVPSNVVVFNLGKDSKNKLTVEVLERADVISGGDLKGTQTTLALESAVTMTLQAINLITDGVTVKTIVLTDANASSDVRYGIASTDEWLNVDGDRSVQFYGDNTEYTIANGTASSTTAFWNAAVSKDEFYAYTVSGTEITLVKVNPTDSSIDSISGTAATNEVTGDALITGAQNIDALSDGLITLASSGVLEIADDVVVLEQLSGKTPKVIDVDSLTAGATTAGDDVVIFLNDDGEIICIVRTVKAV